MNTRGILAGVAFGVCAAGGGAAACLGVEALQPRESHKTIDILEGQTTKVPIKDSDPGWPIYYKIGGVLIGIYLGAGLGAVLVPHIDTDQQ